MAKTTKQAKKTYTEAEDGTRPAKSKPFTPYVKPALGKGKGPVQPKNVARPEKKTKQTTSTRKTAKRKTK